MSVTCYLIVRHLHLRSTLTGHVQHLRQLLSKRVGALDAVVHGDVLDGDEGADVQRSSARMLTWTADAHVNML